MKKLSFYLTTALMFSSLGFANTIEIKEIDSQKNSATLIEKKAEEKSAITICFEQTRSTSIHPSGVAVTTVTYACFNHPEMPGKGTVYINGLN